MGMYSGDEDNGDDITSGPEPEPEHHRSEAAPCAACGAVWVKQPDGSGTMDHADGCSYIAAADLELEGREDWYV